MNDIMPPSEGLLDQLLPFPREWLLSDPQKAEKALNELSIEDQARCFMMYSGKDRQNLLLLSHNPYGLMQVLPDEEIYYTVKEIGPEDAYPMLSVLSTAQVQFFFDMEWWGGDKFLPERAWQWFELMDHGNDNHLLEWFKSEEFEQKIMFLQAFVKVFKRDEATDQYEGVGEKPPWTPDGVYDLFFIKEDTSGLFKRIFIQLYNEDAEIFRALMEGIIWYPITPTVEKAYQWRLSRTADRGLPDFEEAFTVYSKLNVGSLNENPPAPEDFEAEPGRQTLAPTFPLFEADPASFFGQCLSQMKDVNRFDAICWELVMLANKVIVADRLDLGSVEARRSTLKKVLGYINIGLELGAGGDIGRGEKLLSRTWMQSLFQVGYAGVMQLKWDVEALLKDHGPLVKQVAGPVIEEHLAAMIDRFPRIGVHRVAPEEEALLDEEMESEVPEIHWRDLESVEDLQRLQFLHSRVQFRARFVNMVLGLSIKDIEALSAKSRYPTALVDLDVICLTLTALAHYAMFGQVVCEPLSEEAANSFLQVIFLPSPIPGDERALNADILEPFRNRLEEMPLAWTDDDREELGRLMKEVEETLYQQFGGLPAGQSVEWHFTRGLCIQ
ncbi:MAG: hypothetical protein G3M70_07945 [Candidatus Nitronauta litoralis]|uniref:Uncharacterized protein n=1 Tax=Candidatus Nitronauta litoralis TaxID=2705533 RepID=A0A7T0BVM7_9BACT|nr:MAG: hypothetical protein G3M70_07945 [Candidatus Nitronauta litoralis]